MRTTFFVKSNVELTVHTLPQTKQYIFFRIVEEMTTSFDLISPCHTHCQSWPRLQECACRPCSQWAVPHYRPVVANIKCFPFCWHFVIVRSKTLIGFPNVLYRWNLTPHASLLARPPLKEDLFMYDTANGGMVQDGSIEMVTMINAALLVCLCNWCANGPAQSMPGRRVVSPSISSRQISSDTIGTYEDSVGNTKVPSIANVIVKR